MALYIDPAVWPFRNALWAHLISDTSYEELHLFVVQLGVPRKAFQNDHYDLPAPLRLDAIRLGARAVSRHELILTLRAAGLRYASKVSRLPQEAAVITSVSGSEYSAGQVHV